MQGHYQPPAVELPRSHAQALLTQQVEQNLESPTARNAPASPDAAAKPSGRDDETRAASGSGVPQAAASSDSFGTELAIAGIGPALVSAATAAALQRQSATPQVAASPAALNTQPIATQFPIESIYRLRRFFPHFTLGGFVTFIAMLPQAVFAFLLTFEVLESWGTPAWMAALLALTVGVGVEAGKVVLLEFLGRDNWRRLQNEPLRFEATPYNVVELPFRVNAALTFAYLSYAAWADPANGLGNLLRTRFAADTLAAIVETPAFFILLGALESLISNILSFRAIHQFGRLSGRNLANHLLSSSADEAEFLRNAQAHIHGLNLLIQAVNNLVAELRQPSAEHQELIESHLNEILRILEATLDQPTGLEGIEYAEKDTAEKILFLLQKDHAGIDLLQAFQALGRDDAHFDRRVSVAASRFSHALGLTCAGTSVVGLSNFFYFGQSWGNLFFGTSYIGYATGAMSFISMSIMGLLAAEFGINLGDIIAGRETRQNIVLSSQNAEKRRSFESFLVCFILGGLANAEQARIQGQNYYFMASAILASAFLEWYGYGKSRRDGSQNYILESREFGDRTELIAAIRKFILSMQYDEPAHPGPTALRNLAGTCRRARPSVENKDLEIALLDGQGATATMRSSQRTAAPAQSLLTP